MAINGTLFVAIPTVALLLNLFLLLICIGARKNKLVYAFMLLVIGYSLWTGGSAGMRAMMYPGYAFWFEVSIVGIIATPFLLYNFVYQYTNHKGWFTLVGLGLAWLVLIVMAVQDVFIAFPAVTAVAGNRTFSYQMSYWVILPFLVAILTLVMAGRLVHIAIKAQGMPANSMRPVYLGVLVMFAGVLSSALPGMGSFPIDPLMCGVNALILFYALYKKRLITFKMVTSRGPLYLAAAIFTTTLLTITYPWIDRLYKETFTGYLDAQPIVIAVVLSLVTVLIYNLIRRVLHSLFARERVSKEEALRRFSRDINETLDNEQIMKTFIGLIEDNLDCDVAYICMREENGDYVTRATTRPTIMEDFFIRGSNPLIAWLEEHDSAVAMHDFTRTQHYRAMWEAEKAMLGRLNIRLILPITEAGRLIAVALFANKDSRKIGSTGEIIFLESAAAVMSIAARNALLYAAMQQEAQRDGLTRLYNRRHFMQMGKEAFEKAAKSTFTVGIVSLDDFRLYNELYGSHQGDNALQSLAKILSNVIGDNGLVGRYSGKEFIMAVPFRDTGELDSMIELARSMMKDYLRKNKEEGHRFLTFSAGISNFPTTAASFDEAVTFASIAVYVAKKSGKNRTRVYQEGTDETELSPEALQFGERCEQTIYALMAAIDAKDHYTFNHSQNVSAYASQLAAGINLDHEHVEIIRQAGLLHDIGKIGVPESILSKQGPLTPDEHSIMQQHVAGSIEMIKHLPSLDYVTPAAIGHHERWDGKGYPRGLAGEDIPIGARCLGIADSFDAMTTKRSYKAALSTEEALDEIRRNLGTQFDPRLGLVFIKLVEEGTIKPLR